MHLVVFIIRIYHCARSSECQITRFIIQTKKFRTYMCIYKQYSMYRVTIKEIDTFNVVLKRNY